MLPIMKHKLALQYILFETIENSKHIFSVQAYLLLLFLTCVLGASYHLISSQTHERANLIVTETSLKVNSHRNFLKS